MRLIDANKLIKRFKELKGVDSLANMFITDVIKEVKKQPAVCEINAEMEADINQAIEYFKDELSQMDVFSDIVHFQEKERKSIETALWALQKVQETVQGQQDGSSQCATSHG